ncbi:hypothetical protein D9756_007272 [Leucocoprinus leucothites]|uniref:Uncharacterized protein n=1 Tax=Leucocoprinus leucothites TaxID=201217 RepID=A0A8H5FZ66_9AGAR|nr:hypothetical protein D9756_007272 [Leucoagaricus leucothites]
MDIFATTTTDSNPPRHAIESDSEEDEFNPLRHDSQQLSKVLKIQFLGDGVQPKDMLVVATGDPGAFWAKGASLEEQIGAVSVNGVQIGMVFTPKWTTANVVISEALSRLPVWAMHTYAKAIIDTLKPTTLALLDEYSVPGYISNKPIPLPDAPIRYLSTGRFDPGSYAKPFAPPNLINTTSASLLSILSLHTNSTGTLLLLPSPNIPKPAPRTVEPSNFAHLTQDVTEWPTRIMLLAHKLLLRIIGGSESADWDSSNVGGGGSGFSAKGNVARRSEIGEGGMYI